MRRYQWRLASFHLMATAPQPASCVSPSQVGAFDRSFTITQPDSFDHDNHYDATDLVTGATRRALPLAGSDGQTLFISGCLCCLSE